MSCEGLEDAKNLQVAVDPEVLVQLLQVRWVAAVGAHNEVRQGLAGSGQVLVGSEPGFGRQGTTQQVDEAVQDGCAGTPALEHWLEADWQGVLANVVKQRLWELLSPLQS